MRRKFRGNPQLLLALYLNAAGLLVVGGALWSRARLPDLTSTAMAQQQLPIGGGAGVFAVPAQFSPNTYGCYLMDVDAQTLCAYQYFPPDKQLRLIASRSFRYDRRLQNYNTGPSPLEIRDLVEKENAEIRTSDQNKPNVEPEKKE